MCIGKFIAIAIVDSCRKHKERPKPRQRKERQLLQLWRKKLPYECHTVSKLMCPKLRKELQRNWKNNRQDHFTKFLLQKMMVLCLILVEVQFYSCHTEFEEWTSLPFIWNSSLPVSGISGLISTLGSQQSLAWRYVGYLRLWHLRVLAVLCYFCHLFLDSKENIGPEESPPI